MKVMDIAKKTGSNAKKVAYRLRRLEKRELLVANTISYDTAGLKANRYELDIDMKGYKDLQNVIYFFTKAGCCSFAYKLVGRYNLSVELDCDSEKMMKTLADFKKFFSGKYNDYDLSHITEERVIGWSPFSAKP
jgi:DNA-binding Lrp family transcriptional regulator